MSTDLTEEGYKTLRRHKEAIVPLAVMTLYQTGETDLTHPEETEAWSEKEISKYAVPGTDYLPYSSS